MKFQKKLLTSLLAFSLVLGLLFIPSAKVQASTYEPIPTKIHIMLGGTTFSFDYAAYGYSIKNLKSNSSKLEVKQTYQYNHIDPSSTENYASVTMYASAEGTYKITFDIYDSTGTKQSSHTVKVYVNYSTPIKDLKLGSNSPFSSMQSTSNPFLLSGNNGKIKVTMTSGYKLKKIEYGIYDTTAGTYVYHTVKNNKKITYGTKGMQSTMSYTSSYDNSTTSSWSNASYAYTDIRITYLDKYTKQESTISYPFFKWAK